ncbi:MAG: ribosomal protein S12 methylthiotransferase RimO [Firmicutes bacterium CAG_194_44_15]|nr:MAG: ribosomal protein S12 methylthiotransferase RimO [Firmicutes bacterium CAG_194_44_15]
MKIMFISLGCDKNLVDTEMMLGMLAEKGYQFTDDEQEAEIVVVNTCCFIGDAKEESINTLIEIGRLKETANVKMLIAAGCLAQRYRKEIREQIPEVDVIIGTMAIDKIVEAVEEYQTKQYTTFVEDIDRTPVSGKKRVVTTGGHYAYMKIAEGCDKRCSYCIIPKVRGSYRSIPMETLLKEANTLVEQGVKELILVAQETTLYGTDLYGKKSLPELLRKLSEIRGLYWIRILYCYPEEITEELIDTIAELPKVCHYLDIPIQHASDKILKRMGRRTNQQQLKDKIAMIRSKIPDMCLRTTLITGFPGESQEDHEQSMAFVDEMEFDRLGVFTYSAEEDTPAAGFPDQIEEEVKKDRQADIMELQQEIAFEKAEGMTGQDVLVMIEGKVADENAYVGRTYKDAPNVDGLVFVNTDRELMTGDFVPVHITGSYEYDLIGEIKDENEFTK